MLSWFLVKRLVLPVVAVTLVAGGAACADDDSADPAPTTTAPTTTAPTSTDEEQLEQLAEGWFTQIQAIYTGNADVDTASDFVTGAYLTEFTEQVADFENSGRRLKPDPGSAQTIESIEIASGDGAEIIECVVDADKLLDSSGSVINDDTTAFRYSTTAQMTSKGWRLTSRTTTDRFDGASSCTG